VNHTDSTESFEFFLKLLTERKLEKEKNKILTDWDLLTPAQQLEIQHTNWTKELASIAQYKLEKKIWFRTSLEK